MVNVATPEAREWFPIFVKWKDVKAVVKCVRSALYAKKDKASSKETRLFIISRILSANDAHVTILNHWMGQTSRQI